MVVNTVPNLDAAKPNKADNYRCERVKPEQKSPLGKITDSPKAKNAWTREDFGSTRELCGINLWMAKKDGGKPFLTRVFCKTWNCKRCGPLKRKEHVNSILSHIRDAGNPILYCGIVEAGTAWKTINQQLCRHNKNVADTARFAKVKLYDEKTNRPTGLLQIISTIPVEGFLQMDANAAIATFKAAALAIPHVGHTGPQPVVKPITSSKKWPLPPEDEVNGSMSEYLTITPFGMSSPEEVEHAAKQEGLETYWVGETYKTLFVNWELWEEGGMALFIAALKRLYNRILSNRPGIHLPPHRQPKSFEFPLVT